MVESYDTTLTDILKAISDPTRRRILALLVREGPMRVTALAGYFDLSLNAVSKHIRQLEGAGLVSRTTKWREHIIGAEPGPLTRVDAWLGTLRSSWDIRLAALDALLTDPSQPEDDDDD